eukprot:363318-Chlamydomonas_euryale.AAC.3
MHAWAMHAWCPTWLPISSVQGVHVQGTKPQVLSAAAEHAEMLTKHLACPGDEATGPVSSNRTS